MTSGSPRRPSVGDAPPFLGVGWAFPPEFGPGGAQVATVSGVEDVRQSLLILFATRTGERPMQEEFGCNLDEALFGEIDQALINRLTTLIHDAVLRFETRIRLLDVEVTPDPDEAGLLHVRLDYSIVGTNSRSNLVFPFYLNEATTPGI